MSCHGKLRKPYLFWTSSSELCTWFILVLLTFVPNFQVHAEYGDDSARLKLIHIPKTGGSSIFYSFKEHGFIVDEKYYNWKYGGRENGFPKLECSEVDCPEEDCPSCSAWHCPPRVASSLSFTVFRNPFSRLLSEFYESNNRLLKKERVRMMRGDIRKRRICTCAFYKGWILESLRNARKSEHYNDCHFLPQFNFLRGASIVLRFEKLHDDFTRCIRSINGIENVTLNHISGHTGDAACKSQNLNICLTRSLRQKIQQYYKRDFEIYDRLVNSENTNCENPVGTSEALSTGG